MAQKAAPKASEGAPADFPGVVLSNPNGIKPMADTDEPENDEAANDKTMSSGARMWTRNFDGKLNGTLKNGKQMMPDIWEREQ